MDVARGRRPPASPAPFRSATRIASCLLLAVLLTVAPARSQEQGQDTGSPGTLRVFLDCQTWPCDSRYFRTEIRFVDWVRIRDDADVHVILTRESLGGGARRYRIDFVGSGVDVEGVEDQLGYRAVRDATEDEMLAGITRVMSIGLARFAALATGATGLRVVSEGAGAGEQTPPGLQGEVDDPWNYWVFNLGMNGRLDVEERQSSWRVRGRMSADRTTEAWKIRMDLSGNWREREFDVTDTTTFGSIYNNVVNNRFRRGFF